MKLLGLDVASADTGWALFEDSNLINYGLLDIGSFKNGANITNNTLYQFGNAINDIILEQDPDEIAIENIYIGLNKTTGLKLGMMSGIVRYFAYQHTQKEVQTIYPSEVNKAFGIPTVKSDKRKKAIVKCVNEKFKLKLLQKNHDTADAIGIAMVAVGKSLKNTAKKFI
jgi:Holliday junction resolvasome RuvABC endonuclease subunit